MGLSCFVIAYLKGVGDSVICYSMPVVCTFTFRQFNY